jgi:hypothetical protein
MRLPHGFTGPDGTKDYALKIHKNIYGQRQAGRVWFQHLVLRLKKIGFKQSRVDECLFTKGNVLYVLYTDDSLLAGPDEKELSKIIEQMKSVGLELTVEGDVSDFLGVKIERLPDGSIKMTQPHLIDQILSDLRLNGPSVSTKDTPAPISTILGRHLDSDPHDGHFDYRSVVGKLNYLEKCTRIDISYAAHQCARFSSDPRVPHAKAVKWLGRYLRHTRDKGLIFKPTDQSFDCFVDADFCGNWDRSTANSDSDTARSRTGFIIFYAGCPILWSSKLQSQIALSTTEAEYIALSTSLREVLPLMQIIRDLRAEGFDFTATTPKIHCKVFEDNSGALELATVYKFRPRTKHINVQYHHFRQHVESGDLSIHAINTKDQLADIATKQSILALFQKHRAAIMGW